MVHTLEVDSELRTIVDVRPVSLGVGSRKISVVENCGFGRNQVYSG